MSQNHLRLWSPWSQSRDTMSPHHAHCLSLDKAVLLSNYFLCLVTSTNMNRQKKIKPSIHSPLLMIKGLFFSSLDICLQKITAETILVVILSCPLQHTQRLCSLTRSPWGLLLHFTEKPSFCPSSVPRCETSRF